MKRKKIISMPVQTPKCLVGIKATNLKRKGQALKTRNCAYVTLRLFIWKSSVHYETLYNEGLIDDSFSYDYTEENNFGFGKWLAVIRNNLMNWQIV